MQEFTDSDILRSCKPILFSIVKFINDRVDEQFGLEVEQPSFKDANNITRELDIWVHKIYKSAFEDFFGNKAAIIGEEAKDPKKLKANLIASIDAIDGTDLMVKGLSNWCTALFFYSPNDRVIASIVGMHDRVIYYASEAGAKKSWIPKEEESKKTKNKKTKKLVIPQKNRVKRAKNASICFYGQKVDNFLSILSNRSFVKSLKTLIQFKKKNTRSIPLRIYNLGGNPMMIKLAEGKIDAVVELKGQKLYDVIPGAFIATKAGAFWGDLNGNHINDAYLRRVLANPSSKLSYILASNKQLYQELLRFLT